MRKAKCVLADIYIEGVKTNLDILHDIIHSQEFTNGACDTQWLEANVLVLLDSGKKILAKLVQEVNFFYLLRCPTAVLWRQHLMFCFGRETRSIYL